jgi:lipopolysaccharide/colanic/teichoic acid biosynthesis glycosyltransferase
MGKILASVGAPRLIGHARDDAELVHYLKNNCRWLSLGNNMMKRLSVLVLCLVALFMLTLAGCSKSEAEGGVGFSQHGETQAEGHRRHIRNVRLNQQSMTEDVDSFWQMDEPSRLTKKRIP